MKYLAILFLFAMGCKSTNSTTNIVYINNNKLFIEIADTPQKREKGLMHRESLKKNNGMLFIFERNSILSFWMKNTLIPLSIGYIDENCKIIDIQQMLPAAKNEANPKSYPSKAPARYALETNINWFKNNDVEIGDKILIQSNSIKKCSLKK